MSKFWVNKFRNWQHIFIIVTFLLLSVPCISHADLPKTGTFLEDTLTNAGYSGWETIERFYPGVIIANIVKYLLSFLGVIFVILIIYAGFLWMTAGGNEEKIKKAKGLITNATIGLLIVLAAYTITHFVIKYIFEATGGGGDGGGGIDYTD